MDNEEIGVDGEKEATVGVDAVIQITELSGRAPCPEDAKEQSALFIGLDEVVRFLYFIGHLIPQLRLQVFLLHDPAAGWGAQEQPEHLHTVLQLPAFLLNLMKHQEAHCHCDERDGVQSQDLNQVGRFPHGVPKRRHFL